MPDPCDEAAQDPEHYCADLPWCPACGVCGPPGGGGAFWPYDGGYSGLGARGQFAARESPAITMADVVKTNDDGTVNAWITKADGSAFVEPNLEVVSEAGWNAYLANRKVYQKYRQEELKQAYAEWSKDGREYLRSVYSKGTYYPANHDFSNSADVVETNTNGTVNLHARFRRQAGVLFIPKVRVIDPPTLDIWLLARSLWLPIRAKYIAVADAKIKEYLGKDYA